MTNKPPRFIWRWCWKVISPVTIFVVLSMSIKSMSESTAEYRIWDPKQVTKNTLYSACLHLCLYLYCSSQTSAWLEQ